jgi:hypothetical protein
MKSLSAVLHFLAAVPFAFSQLHQIAPSAGCAASEPIQLNGEFR